MTGVSVCPSQAIKVDQANLEYYEKAAGTFNEALAKGSVQPPSCSLRLRLLIG
jgi:hypothetical protein